MSARILCAVSLIAPSAIIPQAANAQDSAASPTDQPSTPAASDQPTTDRNTIVVIGGRMIIAALEKVAVEQTYDEDAVAVYGVGSVGEILDEIRAEHGDETPAILVNGRPNSAPEEIAGLPASAISRIEVLPRGSATRVGGAPGQRAYNVVLRPSVKSITLTAAHEEATENGWGSDRGEAVLTFIRGQDRANLSVRGVRSTALFESERYFIGFAPAYPYSAFGNIIPASGSEVDPAFSALAGYPVSIIALPGSLANPNLSGLMPYANKINPSGEANNRTLRGPSRPVDVTLTGNKQINEWLSLSLNARLNWTSAENWSGLPSGRFLVPASNPYSPFTTGVNLALNDPARPLISRSTSNSQSLTAALNAQRGPWHAALTARWDRRAFDYLSSFTGSLGPSATVDASVNPFGGSLAATIPIVQRSSTSNNQQGQLQFEVQGPIATLWAGAVSTRASIAVTRIDYRATDNTGVRGLVRNQFQARAGVTLPLTSKEGFASSIGDSSIDFDFGTEDLGRFGRLRRRIFALNWQPNPTLRINLLDSREERAVTPELLSSPTVITPNVPYFDPITGQTSNVTLIYGGVASLADEDYRTRSVAGTLSLSKKYGAQLETEYSVNRILNQVGILPPPSSAVVAAFPDRFVRDSQGYLIQVDSRSINFAQQRTKSIRFGARFILPLAQPGPLRRDKRGRTTRTPPMRLAFTYNQTLLLESKATIRAGLPEIDLLDGGAIGIGGGQSKSSIRASLALTRGASGFRLEYARRGESLLQTGTATTTNLLMFDALSTLNVRAFADLNDLLPGAGIPRGTVLTVSIANLANHRQRVTDLNGITPQAYQPIRRDPVGRTVMAELRITL